MSGRILIVDDLAVNRIILKVKLAASCYGSLQAGNGLDALELARSGRPALVLLDMMLPDLSGVEVCRRLRADPATRHIPVVIMTAASDRECRLAALAAGADEFLTKPLNDVILLARIRSLLRAREVEAELRARAEICRDMGLDEPAAEFARPAHIGLIAADPAVAMGWRARIAPHLPAKLSVLSPAAALSGVLDGPPPDLYLVAADLGRHGVGLSLLSELRARERSHHASVSLLVPEGTAAPDFAAMALDLGANDLLTLPLDPEETALRLRLHLARKRRADALRRQIAEGLALAALDPLTGLCNRRPARARLERIAAHSAATGAGFAVMMIDLDRFKAINDRYGHTVGDTVLATVAGRLRDNLRPDDLLARIGGEEFLAVLPDATGADAQAVAERLRRAVGEVPVALAGGGAVGATISIGLAMGSAATGAAEALDHADAALLAAKAEGRDQVTLWPSAA